MSAPIPAVFVDTDTLLNLAQDPKALNAVVDALGDRAHVTAPVLAELRKSVSRHPPVPHARRALATALNMEEIEPSELGPDVMGRMVDLRERVAVPGEPSDKHLGEASSVACAETIGGVVASDDSDARALAQITGSTVVTTGDLLTKMVEVGGLTEDEAETAVQRIEQAGRHIDRTRLRF